MTKAAVVGSGYWGKNLVRNFHALGALTAICDKDAGVLQALQQVYEGVPAVQNFDDLLGDSQLAGPHWRKPQRRLNCGHRSRCNHRQ